MEHSITINVKHNDETVIILTRYLTHHQSFGLGRISTRNMCCNKSSYVQKWRKVKWNLAYIYSIRQELKTQNETNPRMLQNNQHSWVMEPLNDHY